jgi:hypothetical protein
VLGSSFSLPFFICVLSNLLCTASMSTRQKAKVDSGKRKATGTQQAPASAAPPSQKTISELFSTTTKKPTDYDYHCRPSHGHGHGHGKHSEGQTGSGREHHPTQQASKAAAPVIAVAVVVYRFRSSPAWQHVLLPVLAATCQWGWQTGGGLDWSITSLFAQEAGCPTTTKLAP